MKYPYIRKIEPQELADFLNAKGGNSETFKCPVCGNEHQTLVDNMSITNEAKTDVVLQPVLPAFIYPNSINLQLAIEKKEYSEQYQQFTHGAILGKLNQIMYREVIHLVCDNCGHVRSFSKDKIIQWLIDEERYNANK